VPLVVLLPVFFLGGRCFIILHPVWIVIVLLLGSLRGMELRTPVCTRTQTFILEEIWGTQKTRIHSLQYR
jgi:hypothetical protein